MEKASQELPKPRFLERKKKYEGEKQIYLTDKHPRELRGKKGKFTSRGRVGVLKCER